MYTVVYIYCVTFLFVKIVTQCSPCSPNILSHIFIVFNAVTTFSRQLYLILISVKYLDHYGKHDKHFTL